MTACPTNADDTPHSSPDCTTGPLVLLGFTADLPTTICPVLWIPDSLVLVHLFFHHAAGPKIQIQLLLLQPLVFVASSRSLNFTSSTPNRRHHFFGPLRRKLGETLYEEASIPFAALEYCLATSPTSSTKAYLAPLRTLPQKAKLYFWPARPRLFRYNFPGRLLILRIIPASNQLLFVYRAWGASSSP